MKIRAARFVNFFGPFYPLCFSLYPFPMPAPEQPLPAARYGLFLFVATLLILAFYAFSALFLVFGSLFWCAIVLVSFALSYYGLPFGWPVVHSLGASLKSVARGLRLGRGVDFHLTLTREQAPQLWAIIEDLSARLGVAPPNEYVLESGTNAYVMLRGVAAGRGKTRLGVGFDLLAGLSQAQARAVMAHEIAHAKYVRRGYQGFLMRGLFRLGRCAGAIEAIRDHEDNHKLARFTARVIGALPTWLSKTAGKLIAACSRYDEFLADRISAEICGPSPCRQALLSVNVIGHQADKIGYRERLLHLEREGSYANWLREKLQMPDDAKRLEIEARALERAHRHELSTHPALPDRLAAIDAVNSSGDAATLNGQSGLDWFVNADEVGAQLLRHIEQTAATEEAKATKSLAKWMRKQGRGQGGAALLGNNRVGAVIAFVVGVALAVFLFQFLRSLWNLGAHGSEIWIIGALTALVPLVALFGAFDLWRRAPARVGQLPIPPYAYYNAARLQQRAFRFERNADFDARKELSDAEKRALQAHDEEKVAQQNIARGACLRALAPEPDKSKARAHFYVRQGYDALARGDIDGAAHCARLVCEIEPERDEATLIRRVCAAMRGWTGSGGAQTKQIADKHGIGGRWALSWIALSEDNTPLAEALLLELIRSRAANATLRALLGQCQLRNGKPREALASRKLALELHAKSTDIAPELKAHEAANHRFALAFNQIELGQLTEARGELDWLANYRAQLENAGAKMIGIEPYSLDLEEFKWQIARGQTQIALQSAQTLSQSQPNAQTYLDVADALHETSDESLLAASQNYYERALEIGFYPRAKLALAHLFFNRDDAATSRRTLLEALDTRRPRPVDANHPLALLDTVIEVLRTVDDAMPEPVKAWEVCLDAKDLKLDIAQLFLLCLTPDEARARELAQEIYGALMPDEAFDEEWQRRITVTHAPMQYQPDDAAPVGIYGSRWEE